MSDESYFPLKHDESSGHDRFNAEDKEKTLQEVKFMLKKGYGKKMLVWIAITCEGQSVFFQVWWACHEW